LPRPRGILPSKFFGIVIGINWPPADTTQIGNLFWMAQATSMPKKTGMEDIDQVPQALSVFLPTYPWPRAPSIRA
jgi:hypothetical protein